MGPSGWPHKNVDLEHWNEFYNFVNKCFKRGMRYADIDKKIKQCSGYVNAQYYKACKMLNKPNMCPYESGSKGLISKERDLKYYNSINDYLKSGKTYIDFAKNNNLKRGGISNKYTTICKRWNLPNLNKNGKNRNK